MHHFDLKVQDLTILASCIMCKGMIDNGKSVRHNHNQEEWGAA
jgi:hypothetical protein